MSAPPPEPRVARALGIAIPAAVAAAVSGILLLGAGGGSWGASAATARSVGLALALGGLAVAAASALAGAPRRELLRDRVPRLYPFVRPPVSAGIFALATITTACVVSGLFAEYAGALNGGDSSGVPSPAVETALYLGATGIFWGFAIWVLALVAASIRYSAWLERAAGRNVYGRVEADEPEPPPPLGVPSGPAPVRFAEFLFVAALVPALAAMASVQTVEAGADPAAPGAWLALQAFTPVWVAGLALGLAAVDGHVRRLEQRYARARSGGGPGPRDEGTSVEAPGFVHG